VWGNYQEEPQRAKWGVDHPDYNKKNLKTGELSQRATWTEAEMLYIAGWCYKKVKANPDSLIDIVSICLRQIQKDPKALPIFHYLHVVDSGRLRHGYRKALDNKLFAHDYPGYTTIHDMSLQLTKEY
jgi:hypothetical protein